MAVAGAFFVWPWPWPTWRDVGIDMAGAGIGLLLAMSRSRRPPHLWTRGEADHVISIRKAQKHEARIYWKNYPD
jgi:hypothetical protein